MTSRGSGFISSPWFGAKLTNVKGRSVCTTPMMKESPIDYGRIQHAGLLVRDTLASKKFYMDVLGMSDDTELRNKKLPFDGAFLRAGSSQIHLMELPNPDPLEGRPEHGGR